MTEPKKTYDREMVRDLSVKVYCIRLDDMSGGGPGATQRMLDKDNDGGVKLRGRAASFDPLTRAYLSVLGIEPTVEVKQKEKT